MMQKETEDYIYYLLTKIKELYAENIAFRTMNQTCSIPGIRNTWEETLKSLLENPGGRKELDAKFDPHIQKIMQSLSEREAFAALLRSPTKGLPS